jgi:hypothetical protein
MANNLFQWLATGLIALLHPLYISMVDINHNAKDKSLEISVRVFTEDLETTLQKQTTTKVDVTHPANKAFIDKLISTYVQKKLQLTVNGKPAPFNYVGYEIQDESVWAYFEIHNVPVLNKLNVNCSLLYDFQDRQMNIIHVKAKGSEKSYKLDNPKTTTEFNF